MPPVAPAAPRDTAVPELALVYCSAIWGSTFYIVRDAVEAVHPLALVAHRFILAALLLWPLIKLRGGNPWAGLWRVVAWAQAPVPAHSGRQAGAPAATREDGTVAATGERDTGPRTAAATGIFGAITLPPGVLLGGLLFLLYAAQTWGLLYTTAANSGFITGLFIIFIPWLSWGMHGARPHAGQLGAVALALGGMYLLAGGIGGLNSGDVLTLLAAVMYALHVMYTGRYSSLDPLVLCFQQMLLCGVLALALCLAAGTPLTVQGADALWQIAFLAAFPTVSAFAIQVWAQRSVSELRAALIFTLEPVFAAAFAWTLGGEAFIPARALGGGLIVLAMLASEGERLLPIRPVAAASRRRK